jgi:DNA-directed RNA polymerase specialized sigma24 family protein
MGAEFLVPNKYYQLVSVVRLSYCRGAGRRDRYEALEFISLAFITALQLPPRQGAALILRDVLGFPAAETARILDTSKESVTSTLKRGRARWSAGGKGQRAGSLRRRLTPPPAELQVMQHR